MRQAIASWGIPVTTAVIAFDLWNDIIADTEFSSWFDPITKHELVLEGSIGSLLGVQLITDGFRYETLKVLNPGEIYMCGAPQTVGGITQRKELATETINQYSIGRPNRGWFNEEIQELTSIDDEGISYGQAA